MTRSPSSTRDLGPGNLATFLGAEPEYALDTVWYHPCITDPDTHPPLRFDPANPWFLRQQAILEEGMRVSQGRFLVGMPDLVENVDILAALRDSQKLMFDLIERPDWVHERLAEINQVYFAAFERYFDIIRDPWGGNAFSAFYIWGPGKTAKVQCDAGAMISPRMFRQFVVPALTEQCEWLDYSLFHLDGTQAIHSSTPCSRSRRWTRSNGRRRSASPRAAIRCGMTCTGRSWPRARASRPSTWSRTR